MAKDFGKLNNKKIEAVAKKSNESANVITVKMIGSDDLLDYPKNNEDISQTEDLELSMKQNGFTDPIEVTTFGCDDGKYMIVSGHRRRAAGVKVGISTFPCIVKTFKNEADVFNYVLLANSQRDSAKDPLLFCKRYKMHEECLKEAGFKGNVREEIAKRLGLSVQQADRYNQMNKIILPVWDMVRDEIVGMSSVLPMSKFFPEHQEEIVDIFNQCIEAGERLSREMCKKLIDEYKAGKKSYDEIIKEDVAPVPVDNIITAPAYSSSYINPEPTETKEKSYDRRNEINYDTSHREGLDSDKDPYADERLTEEDYAVINSSPIEKKEDNEDKKAPVTEQEKRLQRGKKISDLIAKLRKELEEHYSYEVEEDAEIAITNMTNLASDLFDGISYIASSYEDEIEDKMKKAFERLQKDIKGLL